LTTPISLPPFAATASRTALMILSSVASSTAPPKIIALGTRRSDSGLEALLPIPVESGTERSPAQTAGSSALAAAGERHMWTTFAGVLVGWVSTEIYKTGGENVRSYSGSRSLRMALATSALAPREATGMEVDGGSEVV